MNVYRLTNWTHREGKTQFSFRADPKGTHAVMIAIGNIPKDTPLTKEMLLEMMDRLGFVPKPDLEIEEKKVTAAEMMAGG